MRIKKGEYTPTEKNILKILKKDKWIYGRDIFRKLQHQESTIYATLKKLKIKKLIKIKKSGRRNYYTKVKK